MYPLTGAKSHTEHGENQEDDESREDKECVTGVYLHSRYSRWAITFKLLAFSVFIRRSVVMSY